MKFYERICASVSHSICHSSYETVIGQAEPLYDNAFVVKFKTGMMVRVFFYADCSIICFDVSSQKTLCTINYSLNDTVDNVADRIVNKLNP